MNRSRDFYRYQKRKHIKRKLGILYRLGGEDAVRAWSGNQPGRLSKGKIHCSCWMCRSKSYDELRRSDKKNKTAALQQVENFWLGVDD